MQLFYIDEQEFSIPNSLVDKYDIFKHGSQLDISPDILASILKYPEYPLEENIDTSEFYRINVGSRYFYSRAKTLIKSSQLETLLNSSTNHEINLLTQNPVMFAHILEYLRNPAYIVPEQYDSDFKLYGIKKYDSFDNVSYGNTLYLLMRNKSTNKPKITHFKKMPTNSTTNNNNIVLPKKLSKNVCSFVKQLDDKKIINNMYLKMETGTIEDIDKVELRVTYRTFSMNPDYWINSMVSDDMTNTDDNDMYTTINKCADKEGEASDICIYMENKSMVDIAMDMALNLSNNTYKQNNSIYIPLLFDFTKILFVCNQQNKMQFMKATITVTFNKAFDPTTKLGYIDIPSQQNFQNIESINTPHFSTTVYNFDNYQISIPLTTTSNRNISAFVFHIKSPNQTNSNFLSKATLLDSSSLQIAHTNHLTSLHTFANLKFNMKHILNNYYIINFCLNHPTNTQSSGHVLMFADDHYTLRLNLTCKSGTIWLGTYERIITHTNTSIPAIMPLNTNIMAGVPYQ